MQHAGLGLQPATEDGGMAAHAVVIWAGLVAWGEHVAVTGACAAAAACAQASLGSVHCVWLLPAAGHVHRVRWDESLGFFQLSALSQEPATPA